MVNKSIKILLVDDDEDDFVLTRDILDDIEEFEFELEWQKSFSSALDRIKQQDHDIYFVDYRLGEADGIDLIKESVAAGVSAPMVLLTGKGNRKVDRQAMEQGAADFLVKSELTPQMMERCIRYALKHSRALQMVKEGEDKFRQLFQRSIDAIYISDLNHELKDVNLSFCQLFGVTSERTSLKSLKEYFEKADEFERFSEDLKEHGQVKDFQASLKPDDQQPFACQLTSVVRTDFSGKIIGYQGIIRDMTLHIKAERELLMAEKLAMTGKIARSIAHEVRNPLTNLGLALDQLEDELPKGDKDISMFMGIIERNAKRIGQLITEMLNSSKPKELHKEKYNINEVLDDAVNLIRDRITLKGMKLHKQYDERLEPVWVDAEKLKIAIINVLVNAVEAMDESKGELTVESSLYKGMIQLTITDNGSGIPEEHLHTLFDPFFTNKQGGMGLGLTSAQNIINSHGGTIHATSQVGTGTSFVFLLPPE
ncbi:response regulator [Fulvivirga sp. M361]|uniref:hybrid sensor histidine kinase/response regulator n=1 Tax=Fulvivirga sp. M361 TaxID=2594266 RepID=UPI00117A7D9B|nr:ATP-binding protein [Fulvivirga sp. M361]TRX60486.1 response regulator [Fulvivirga sp. M361]